MYQQYYGFKKKPFSISPDPDFIYLNACYREALSVLRYGIEERKGIVCLIGEVGTGKTMLLNKLLLSIRQEVLAPVLAYPECTFSDLVENLINQLKVPVASELQFERLRALKAYLNREARRNRIVVLLMDEAQTLSVKALEGLRQLSNIETPREKLIQIVLSGQPELKDILNLTELRQFKQRIATSFQLGPLPAEEINLYIAHRMKVAGNTQGLRLFSEGALSLVADYTRGTPRLINALCENALLIGYALGKPQIDAPIINEAAKDLMLTKAALPDMVSEDDASSAPEGPKPKPPLFHSSRANREKTRFWRPLIKWAAVCLICILALPAWEMWFPGSIPKVLNDIRHSIGTKLMHRQPHSSDRPIITKYVVNRWPSTASSAPDSLSDGDGAEAVPAGDSLSPSRDLLKKGDIAEPGRADMTSRRSSAAESLTQETENSIPAGSQDPSVLKHPFSEDASPTASATKPLSGWDVIDPTESATPLPKAPDPMTTVRDIRPGETISGMAMEVYGHLNPYVYGLIYLANPRIENLDHVVVGGTVSFPPLILASRIFANNDGAYSMLASVCQDPMSAGECKTRLVAEGAPQVEIEPTWITSTIKLYLLRIRGYHSREEALNHLQLFASAPAIKDLFEQDHPQGINPPASLASRGYSGIHTKALMKNAGESLRLITPTEAKSN